MRFYCVYLLNCNMLKGKLATFTEKIKDIYIYVLYTQHFKYITFYFVTPCGLVGYNPEDDSLNFQHHETPPLFPRLTLLLCMSHRQLFA